MFFGIRKMNRGAQITSEYAILLAVIIAVLAGMQVYMKRGIQARLMDAADYPVSSGVFITGGFEPEYSFSNRHDIRSAASSEFMDNGLSIIRQTTETLDSNITSVIGNSLRGRGIR